MAARTRAIDPDLDPVDDIDEDLDDKPRKRGGRKAALIIFFVFLFILIGGFVAIIALNLFGVRDEHIYPALRNVPFVGQFIPSQYYEIQLVYDEESGEYVEVRVAVDPPVVEEVPVDVGPTEEVLELMAEIEALQAALSQAQSLNAQYEETVQVLATYRDFITEYRENRQRFDAQVALGDPNAFAEFYETVDPENAARLFSYIRATQQEERDFRRYASTYHTMNSSEAAEVFAILLATDAPLLVRILNTFNHLQRAETFNEMEPADVAVITRLMVPDTPVLELFPSIPVFAGPGAPIPQFTPDTPPAAAEEPAAEEEAVEEEETAPEEEE